MDWFKRILTKKERSLEKEITEKFHDSYIFNCEPKRMALFSFDTKSGLELYISPGSKRQGGMLQFLAKYMFEKCPPPRQEGIKLLAGETAVEELL